VSPRRASCSTADPTSPRRAAGRRHGCSRAHRGKEPQRDSQGRAARSCDRRAQGSEVQAPRAPRHRGRPRAVRPAREV